MRDRFIDYINDEIDFHQDHITPWHMRLYCWLTRQKTPQEVLLLNLELTRLYYLICKGEWEPLEEKTIDGSIDELVWP